MIITIKADNTTMSKPVKQNHIPPPQPKGEYNRGYKIWLSKLREKNNGVI